MAIAQPGSCCRECISRGLPMTDWKSWLGRHHRLLLLVLLLTAIEVSYVAILTAGRFTSWPTWNSYYDMLAEGFRAGHLHLAVSPPPALLAKANPFDPIWRPLWLWDASLHGDHYYLYWGPLPAVAIAAFKTVFRIDRPIGDQFPVFAFYTIYLVAGSLLIVRLSQRLFEHIPLWLIALCIAVFAYANPTPYLLATPGIYEAAIAGGQAFLVLGLLLAWEALWCDRPRGRGWLLIAAGSSWAFAFACRASTILPAALFVVITALALSPPASWRRAWRSLVGPVLQISTPIAVIVAAHMTYNKLRLDAGVALALGRRL